MEYEVEAERTKRRDILLAEAKKIAQVFVSQPRLMLKLEKECMLFN